MSDSFNSYLNQIDSNVWRDICVRMGELRHYSKGEDFVTIGHIGKYIGYIVAGTLKYVAYSDDGSWDWCLTMVWLLIGLLLYTVRKPSFQS